MRLLSLLPLPAVLYHKQKQSFEYNQHFKQIMPLLPNEVESSHPLYSLLKDTLLRREYFIMSEIDYKIEREEDETNVMILLVEADKGYSLDQAAKSKVMDHIPEIVFYKDHDLIYRGANKACMDFYNERGVEEIIGKTDLELDMNPAFLKECHDKDVEVINTGKPIEFVESYYDLTTQQNYYFQTKKSPIYLADGSLWGIVGVVMDITNDIQRKEELEYFIIHDTQTKLYNRTYFDTLVKEGLPKEGYPYALVCTDINSLKTVNDTLGHHRGDELISICANAIHVASREDVHSARIGGDEFICLLPNVTMERVDHFFKDLNRETNQFIGDVFPTSMACSMVLIEEHDDLYECYIRADREMYHEKIKMNQTLSKTLLDNIIQSIYDARPQDEIHIEELLEYSKLLHVHGILDKREYETMKTLSKYRIIGRFGMIDENKDIEFIVAEKGYNLANRIYTLHNVSYEILTQFEHFDGTGFPLSLKEDEIPYLCRISRILDYIIYHKQFIEDATSLYKSLQPYAGTHLDPVLLEKIINIL